MRALAARSSYKSPRLAKALATAVEGTDAQGSAEQADLLCVVGYGRVPHKIPKRIPIGLALALVSDSIEPTNRAAADRLAAKGLVTWVNYPTLAPEQGGYGTPTCTVDGRSIAMTEAVNVTSEVTAQWRTVEGRIILSAITRMVARLAVGEGIQTAGGRDNPLAFLASLGAQVTLTALDTPDTRSWETLPARIAVGRIRVAPGKHTVTASARGATRTQPIDVGKGGFATVSLQALR